MTKLISPAPYGSAEVGLLYGATKKPYSPSRPHKGRDWKWRYIAPIKSRQVHANVSGRVIAAFDNGDYRDGWGNYVEIEVVPGVSTRLCHLRTGSVLVKPGQHIKAGDQVGVMGATGRTSGLIHLHEELRINGLRVNPDTYRGANGKHLPGTEPKPSPAPAGDPFKTRQLVLANLNLRNAPGTKGTKVLLTIPKGSTVRSGAFKDGWNQIKTSAGKIGWVDASFIVPRDQETSADLNLRKTPSTASPKNIIKTLPKGTDVLVIGVPAPQENDHSVWRWVKLADGTRGYVHRSFLKVR